MLIPVTCCYIADYLRQRIYLQCSIIACSLVITYWRGEEHFLQFLAGGKISTLPITAYVTSAFFFSKKFAYFKKKLYLSLNFKIYLL